MKKSLKLLLFALILISIIALTASFFILKKINSVCSHESITVSTLLPTCTSEGCTVYSCNTCSYRYTTNPTSPTPHKYIERIIPPTCASEGYTLYFCICGDFYLGEDIPPLEHTFTENLIAATCSEGGYTERSCLSCGYSVKELTSSPTPHSYTSTVFRPTSLEAGYTEHICACSESYKDSFINYSEILDGPYLEESTVLAHGIDVSRWNHQIDTASGEYLPLDWQKIKSAGFDFVILKAGSTLSGKEPTFEADYADAKAAGLDVGVYFYTYSSTVDGIKNDVSALLSYLSGKVLEYPVYFDLEDPSLTSIGKDALTELCEVFICSMQKNGYYSALYTNNNWLKNILDTSRILSLFDIWYARYPLTDAPVWNEEKYGKQLSMWQYTQSGEIAGIDGYFDMNFCYRDYINIMKKWKLNGF